MQEISESLKAALAHHRSGELAEAKRLYEQILQAQPEHPDALHYLGLLACQVQQHEVGITLMERSIAVQAQPQPAYYNNLGNMLMERGRLAQAIEHYRRAVSLKPDYPEAHNNLGNALREARQPQASMLSCAQAIELRPGYAEAYNNLGNALQDLGELEAAAASYGKAVALRPAYAQAHNNLGNVQRAQGRRDEAIESYRQAVSLMPQLRMAHHSLGLALRERGALAEAIGSLRRGLGGEDANAHNSLGCALRDAGELEEAVTQFEAAVALDPKLAIAHCNLGGALRRQKKYDVAIVSCQRALELDPRLGEAYSNLGNAYHELQKHEAAELSYRHALELNPDDAVMHHNLAVLLVEQRKLEEALASCRKALLLDGAAAIHATHGDILHTLGQHEAAVDAYLEALERGFRAVNMYYTLMFSMTSVARFSPETVRGYAARFGERAAEDARPWHHVPASTEVTRPLRVGFVSGDLKCHPVAFFLENVVAHLNRERVQLVAYSTHAFVDQMTVRLKPRFERWHDVSGMPDDACANLIRADRIDILVDLSGHTAYSRLSVFAWKPAPVQVTWLGFFATTGLEAIDYILADRHVLPESEASHFVEKPWRLPDSYLCFAPPEPEIAIGSLPASQNGFVTFGCLNSADKIGDSVVALWSRVLHAVPGSRLLLKASQFMRPTGRSVMTERFGAHGIANERLLLEGFTTRTAHLETYNRVDLALDPFPYPGGTTSVESLWMGVPVLTRRGDRFLSHVGETIAHTAGMADWIAADDDDYISKAVAFSADRERLRALRAGLREQLLASPLCDAARFARNLEEAFEGMWKRYIAGAPDGT
ncbi:protein O-GlcNAc transferase [Paraburkholderia sp. GAS448]|uniref:tetratricopeptide repeat protein n=1 Tax=Paraburkholderia sp. GAS448 TaxID=3035136 RepID=UPI003D213877